MNIVGVGTDIVDVKRILDIWKRWGKKFIQKIFRPEEIPTIMSDIVSASPERISEYLAARVALKEAAIKAVPEKSYFKDFVISRKSDGGVEISFNNNQSYELKCSISHERQFAISFVVAEKLY